MDRIVAIRLALRHHGDRHIYQLSHFNTPDLTAEGSFTFGLAVSAIVTVSGHPFLGIILAVLAGALAGAVTAFLQTKLFIHPVLAGIFDYERPILD